MNLYFALTNYVEGRLDINTFNRAYYRDFFQIGRDNPNKQKSLIVFEFDSDEYYKLFITDDSNNNTDNRLLNIALSNGYHGYGNVFYDDYTASDDLEQGYVFHYFDDENKKMVDDILSYVNPGTKLTMIDEMGWEDISKIAKILIQFFDYEMDELSYHYSEVYDDALVEGLRQYVRKKLCNQFENYWIYEKRCSKTYFSTVGNIINQWDKLGLSEDDTMVDFFKKLIEDNSLEFDEDLWEDYHSYFDRSNFDLEGFNSDVNRILTKILDKVEGEIDESSLKERIKIINFFTKNNIDFNKILRFPSSKFLGKETIKKTFMINSIDDGKINLTDFSKSGTTQMKMNLDDFKNYYFHPELF